MGTNQLLIERLNIISGAVPVAMNTAGLTGDWVSMKGYNRLIVVLFKAAGTAGDDPTLTLQQATAVAGTGAKALTVIDTVYKKQGADLASVNAWTKVTQTAASTYTDATSAELQAIWAVEIRAEQLDVDNGFDCIRATVADVGTNSQIGCLFYLAGDPRYHETPADAVNPIAN